MKTLIAVTVFALLSPAAFAFDAPSGNYGRSFTFTNNGSTLTLLDRDLGAAYILRLDDATREQPMAPEFYNPSLYAHPQVRLQRSFIKDLKVTNVEQITDNVIRAKVKMDIGFKTIAGNVLAGTESTVVVGYGRCRSNDYSWQTNKCLKLEIQGTRLSSFQSPLGEALNQAMGMVADIFVQTASAISKLKLRYDLEQDFH